MVARIYCPARNAMQSGKAKTDGWVLEYEPEQAREIEPLMGWTSSSDMRSQLRLSFETKDQAVAYARAHGIPYRVFEPPVHRTPVKTYSDNFRYDRKAPWSH